MQFWLDTEFNEFRGDLISMALVGRDGREWYEVLPCPSPGQWVAENVIPVLGRHAVTRKEMQRSLQEFLRPYAEATLIADWPEDIQHFCALLITGQGTRIDTPPLSMRIERYLDSSASLVPHNALADARALRAFDLAHK